MELRLGLSIESRENGRDDRPGSPGAGGTRPKNPMGYPRHQSGIPG